MLIVRTGYKICYQNLLKESIFSQRATNTLKIQNFEIFRPLHLSMKMSSLKLNFEDAVTRVKSLKEEPGNDIKLKLYALYKQSTEGSCSSKKPSAFDFVGKAKWEAWKALDKMTQDEAKNNYISFVNELCAKDTMKTSDVRPSIGNQYEGLTYEVGPNFTQITFCRPNKYNAITVQMYKDIISALKEASENDTAVTVLTGQGDYFSSGNDLSNFANIEGDLASAARNGGELFKSFVAAFIDFPKILVAAVNGPAVGIPVTILGLCDVVYASEKATFHTPFSLLGQSPEGCSTYIFPKIMGYSKANEMILFNKKLNASEAKAVGLVSKVFPHDTFLDDVKKELDFIPSASKQSMIHTKELIRQKEKNILHAVNEAECERLVERWQSQDCMEAVMRFLQKKSKI